MLAVCHPYWTGPLGMALLDVCLFEDLGEEVEDGWTRYIFGVLTVSARVFKVSLVAH